MKKFSIPRLLFFVIGWGATIYGICWSANFLAKNWTIALKQLDIVNNFKEKLKEIFGKCGCGASAAELKKTLNSIFSNSINLDLPNFPKDQFINEFIKSFPDLSKDLKFMMLLNQNRLEDAFMMIDEKNQMEILEFYKKFCQENSFSNKTFDDLFPDLKKVNDIDIVKLNNNMLVEILAIAVLFIAITIIAFSIIKGIIKTTCDSKDPRDMLNFCGVNLFKEVKEKSPQTPN